MHGVLPEKGEIKHLLWTFSSSSVPKARSSLLCRRRFKGRHRPKTFCKWVWKFCEAIAELHVEVVSF